jgi:hypothetical protein
MICQFVAIAESVPIGIFPFASERHFSQTEFCSDERLCEAQMGMTVPAEFKELYCTIRVDQGYRYLDRCGEAMVRLERVLEDGWLVGETTPAAGILRHFDYGLTARLNTTEIHVEESRVISYPMFKDQTSKIYETAWRLFEIETIRSPAFRAVVHVGFDTIQEVENYINDLGMASPNPDIVTSLGGTLDAMSYAIVVTGKKKVGGKETPFRNRLSARGVRQTTQPDFDQRALLRLPLISKENQKAIRALLELRRVHVSPVVCSAEISIEHVLDAELATIGFSIKDFLDESHKLAESFLTRIRNHK